METVYTITRYATETSVSRYDFDLDNNSLAILNKDLADSFKEMGFEPLTKEQVIAMWNHTECERSHEEYTSKIFGGMQELEDIVCTYIDDALWCAGYVETLNSETDSYEDELHTWPKYTEDELKAED